MSLIPIDQLHSASPSSLYVHIPFCKSRCFYCDFNTYVAPESVMEEYVQALAVEFQLLGREATSPLKTAFFGGGTPTLPSVSLLERMLKSMHAHFSFTDDVEITFESNPDSVDAEKLKVLRDYGVNRISFGAQTFQERLLLAIGRSHDASAVYRSVETAAAVGFEHINVDLMFGLPDQSMDDVSEALTAIQSLPIDHASAYWLKVESKTPFGKWHDAGQLSLPGEDLEADMYDVVRNQMVAAGFRHYEISNFAKPGGEAQHNLVYWRNQPYFAAGAGAHGYVRGVRYENLRKIPEYLEPIASGHRPIDDQYEVTGQESTEDFLMLGLRLDEGVSIEGFKQRYGVSIDDQYGETIQALLSQGLLEHRGDAIRIPDKYWPVANGIFEKFVSISDAN